MKYVIIGCSGHYNQALEICSPAAIAKGSDGEDITRLQAQTNARLYNDYRDMLEHEKPDIAVVNPWFCDTASISAYCLLKGIHVYSEKPLATEFADLELLKGAYSHSDADIGCMFNLNCCAWYRCLESAIADGQIGSIRQIHGQKSYRMGIRGQNYQNRSTYGGTIPWVAIHAVDWVLRLGGKCNTISALHSRIENKNNNELEATSAILMRLENEIIATVTADFFRPIGSARHDDDRLRVTGTHGCIEAIDGHVFLENSEPKHELTLPAAVNPFKRFVDGLGTQSNKQLADEAFYDTKICLLARQAADTRQLITL